MVETRLWTSPLSKRERPHYFKNIHILSYIDMFKSKKLLCIMDGLNVHNINQF